jgi:hypothetical protein
LALRQTGRARRPPAALESRAEDARDVAGLVDLLETSTVAASPARAAGGPA